MDGEAHIRHFATHPDWQRQGIGAALLTRCFHDAKSAGIHTLHCYSTLNAEPFYHTHGFRAVEAINVPMGANIFFPAVLMQAFVP